LGYDVSCDDSLDAHFLSQRKSNVESKVFSYIKALLSGAIDQGIVTVEDTKFMLGGMLPDITVTDSSGKVFVIEVDGPTHYYRTGAKTAETLMRDRIYDFNKIPHMSVDARGDFYGMKKAILEDLRKHYFFNDLLMVKELKEKNLYPLKRRGDEDDGPDNVSFHGRPFIFSGPYSAKRNQSDASGSSFFVRRSLELK
jgi:hypothetical protein